MDEPRPAASRRLLGRLLRRAGLSESEAPGATEWAAFLDLARALLADQEQERYLLERSLENSSQEMLSLYESLRASAEQLAADHQQLRTANSVLAATLESTADGILVVATDGSISSFNRRFAQMWGLPDHILESRDDNAALEFVLSQLRDPQVFIAKVEALYQTPEEESHDTLEFKDGRVFERESLPQRLDGEIIGRVWSFRDITAERRLTDELQHRALHDALTGLANRAAFDEHLARAIRRQARTGGYLAVVLVDLDGFKHINDSLGHQAGDAVLVAVAERLRTAFRDLDTIARLGGDEFALLVEDVSSPDHAARLGQRLLDLLTEPVELGGRQVALGASIGITLAGGDSRRAEGLLGQADAAMYRAKQDGKGRYQLFEASMHARAVERLNLEQALRKAVAADGLTLQYQPVVEAGSGRVVSFEALARWNDPVAGAVPPDTFIPLAEETGLIHDIGRSVLLAGCRQARAWLDHGHRVGIAVNVSRRQFLEPTFGESVRELVDRTTIDPRLLTLEITETVFATDSARVVSTVDDLRRLGIQMAIDDFGTGYSSFASLADLPVDTLKIDRRFVQTVTQDVRRQGLVRAIVGIAETLGLTTVAEGVETPEQQEILVSLGCTYLQGYLFARPMDATATSDYLGGRHRLPTAG